MDINSTDALRKLYAQPRERAMLKQLESLDSHCRRFIERSPFLVMSTADQQGRLDASPRGGPPGFVRVLDSKSLLIPDSPGNNRLDSLENIIYTRRAGLLFMIPGMDETLRVNGSAQITTDAALISTCDIPQQKKPLSVIRITVEEAYLHCAKALMRARLWDPQTRIQRNSFPTMNQMIHDQIGDSSPPESQQAMVERYKQEL